MRSHFCGQVNELLTGQTVRVAGWVHRRRDHGGVIFVDLRDRDGLLQVVIDPGAPGGEDAARIRSEYVLQITGTVRPRPDGTVNPDLPTGEVEVAADAVVILNEAEPPPFPLHDRGDGVDESLRLRHR